VRSFELCTMIDRCNPSLSFHLFVGLSTICLFASLTVDMPYCMYVYVPVSPSICLSVQLSICLFDCRYAQLFVCPCSCQSIRLSFHLFVCLFTTYLFACLTVSMHNGKPVKVPVSPSLLSVHLCVCLSIHLSVHLSVCLSIYLSVGPSVCFPD